MNGSHVPAARMNREVAASEANGGEYRIRIALGWSVRKTVGNFNFRQASR